MRFLSRRQTVSGMIVVCGMGIVCVVCIMCIMCDSMFSFFAMHFMRFSESLFAVEYQEVHAERVERRQRGGTIPWKK